MPVPVILSDLSQVPLTPPAPDPRKPSITVILGKDVKEHIERVSGHESRLPTVQLLLAQALVRELTKVFPLAIVEVSYDFARMSCLQAVEEIEATLMENRALPVIRDVLSNEQRYEWDGRPLATPAAAIAYVLNIAQTDADLGYLLGPGTQAFRLLCEAEAGLTKQSLNDVLTKRGKLLTKEPRRYLTATEHDRAERWRENDAFKEIKAAGQGATLAHAAAAGERPEHRFRLAGIAEGFKRAAAILRVALGGVEDEEEDEEEDAGGHDMTENA